MALKEGRTKTVGHLPHDAVVRVDKRVKESSRAKKLRCGTRGARPTASSGDDTRLGDRRRSRGEPAASLHRGRCPSGGQSSPRSS